ncbi:thiamine phosphate synthase [Ancylobacter sp. Lp-2]|uniref:thiamine phosphate synthase n=1 Tax=Ancylobacter sp. Lp-2 TaxID=2881339 RepID=UPI001E435B16|nr:thiamine phosphate synthase [Ancylobacter sp. Lp-2]MCB4770926.1 thiamine phosphate synthase [Ancylobacter sp. Lp-2]
MRFGRAFAAILRHGSNMAKSDTIPAPPAPRLYLLLPPPDGDAGRLVTLLRDIVAASDLAAVLVRPGEASAAALRELVAACQQAGAACLIDGNAAFAAATQADGVHAAGLAALKAALTAVRPDGIAGVGDLRTKHDAMTAGESGTDYVMFGEPDAQGRRPPFEATRERVQWWSDIFEIPCVAYARTLEEVDILVAAGADFIAVDNLLIEAPAEGGRALASRLVPAGAA